MSGKLAAALVGLSLILGVGVGYAVNSTKDDPKKANPTPTATSPTFTDVNLDEFTDDEGSLIFKPGAVGPVEAGMTVKDAVATGLIVEDPARAKSCELDPDEYPFYKWVGDKAAGLDILVDQKGKVASIAAGDNATIVAEPKPGGDRIQVGSNYLQLKATYGAELSEPEVAGYDQIGLFVRDGAKWVGFLFNEQADTLRDGSTIAMIEVTYGHQPSLMRDGC